MQESSTGTATLGSVTTPASDNKPRLPISNGYVVTAIDKATSVDYLSAIVKVIGQSKVKSFGRMGRNFAFWVNDEDSVETMEVTTEITVKNQTAMIWPYINPIRRIKLMGVPPFIPNGLIEEELKQYGSIKGVIKIEDIYGLPEEFGKIESFNRTLSLSCDRKTVLPNNIKVKMNEREYEILLQVGRRKCFKCDSILHISANCTGKQDKTNVKDPKKEDKVDKKKNTGDPKTTEAEEES